MNTTVKAAVW